MCLRTLDAFTFFVTYICFALCFYLQSYMNAFNSKNQSFLLYLHSDDIKKVSHMIICCIVMEKYMRHPQISFNVLIT